MLLQLIGRPLLLYLYIYYGDIFFPVGFMLSMLHGFTKNQTQKREKLKKLKIKIETKFQKTNVYR